MNTLISELIGFLNVHNDDVTYFDSFRVEHIVKEIRTFVNCPSPFVPRFAMLRIIKT